MTVIEHDPTGVAGGVGGAAGNEEEDEEKKKTKTKPFEHDSTGVAGGTEGEGEKKKKTMTKREEAPEGWTIVFSEEHNTNFYRNNETGEEMWSRPEEAVIDGEMVEEEQQKKKRRKKTRGWSTISQGAESAPYFVNDHTGETTWDAPTLPAAPKGWSVHAHGDEGQHFFQDDAGGGATQWHHPHDDAPHGIVELAAVARGGV